MCEETPNKITEVVRLNDKIEDLSEELDIKTIEIEELYAILESFEGQLEKGKYGNKFAREIIDAVKETGDLVVSFHKFMSDVETVEEREKQLRNTLKQ